MFLKKLTPTACGVLRVTHPPCDLTQGHPSTGKPDKKLLNFTHLTTCMVNVIAAGAWLLQLVHGYCSWCMVIAAGAWLLQLVHGYGSWCVVMAAGACPTNHI